MAHFAIVTSLITGRIHSSYQMVSRLQNEGHSVTYICQPSTISKIEKNGFTCVPLPELNLHVNPYPDNHKLSWKAKFKFHHKNKTNHFKESWVFYKIDEVKAVLTKVNPDVIIVDTELHDVILPALDLEIPIKLWTTWWPDTISSSSPSLRTSVIPGRGFNGTKLGIIFSWMKMRTKIYGRLLIDRLTFVNYRRSFFKQYANKIGFDTNKMYVNTLPPLWSFSTIPIVSLGLKEIEFPHDYSENAIYLGPMIYEGRIDNSDAIIDWPKLNAVFKKAKEKQKKIVYCSVGSLVAGDQSFLERVIQAVSEIDFLELVLSIGPKMTIESFKKVPANVHLFNWVPQIEVLKQSDCAIIACGNNSINECLHFEVPMLLYSGNYTDQNGNAARMTYHGLGILGNEQADSSEQISQNLTKILTDPVYADNIKRFTKVYQLYNQRELAPILLS